MKTPAIENLDGQSSSVSDTVQTCEGCLWCEVEVRWQWRLMLTRTSSGDFVTKPSAFTSPARGHVPRSDFDGGRLLDFAAIERQWATRMETTAFRHARGTWNLAL